jgi:hypothetical protein
VHESERRDVDETALVTHAVRRYLASKPVPDVREAVMRRITEGPERHVSDRRAGRVIGAIRWFWTPHAVVVRPAAVCAVACALMLLTPLAFARMVRQLAHTPDERPLFVQFRLQTAASRVQLAGSFTNWEPRYELHEVVPGTWIVTVPLTQGVHDYAFVIDGRRWMPDPYAPSIGDGFGGQNSRLTLLSPAGPRT